MLADGRVGWGVETLSKEGTMSLDFLILFLRLAIWKFKVDGEKRRDEGR
jgi:hypothetical protein